LRPKEGFLYLNDQEKMHIGITVIIGKMLLEVYSKDEQSGIDQVRMIIDGEDYMCQDIGVGHWRFIYDRKVFFRMTTLVVKAMDKAGNVATTSPIAFLEIF
jgi:hypothetical protein